MKLNEKGFTFTEMLLVFSCFLIISSVTLILVKPQNSIIETRLFFTQLKSDLYFAQQYAISHQREVTVNIVSQQNYYYIRDRITGPILVQRTYSEQIKVMEASIPLYFQFLPDGNISRFGSFLVKIDKVIYRFTFLIGKGRFYVTKE